MLFRSALGAIGLVLILSSCGGGSTPDTRLADALDGFIKPYMAANGITATTLAV